MANIEKTFRHDTLGLINVVWKSNMRSVRMSFKDGRFTISAPVGYTMESIARLIQENESRMHSFIKRHEARRDDTRVDENFILDTHFAIMRISLTDVATSRLKKSKTPVGANPCGCPSEANPCGCPSEANPCGCPTETTPSDKDEMVLEMPINTDFDSPEAKQIVKEAAIAVLRYEAKKRLPYIVKEIADANGFKYSSVKINSAQTRWGSCSSKGSLNFSLYTMLMPLHLIRSVVVHELCHTKFMDHGPNFWALFDKTFGVSHRIVDKEIRDLKLPGFLKN